MRALPVLYAAEPATLLSPPLIRSAECMSALTRDAHAGRGRVQTRRVWADNND